MQAVTFTSEQHHHLFQDPQYALLRTVTTAMFTYQNTAVLTERQERTCAGIDCSSLVSKAGNLMRCSPTDRDPTLGGEDSRLGYCRREHEPMVCRDAGRVARQRTSPPSPRLPWWRAAGNVAQRRTFLPSPRPPWLLP